MLHRMLLPLALLVLAGCDTAEAPDVSETCDEMCEILVTDCAYGAYPSMDSCLQGCTWYESEGVAVDDELDCIRAAACDTFQILECEHTYGME